MNKSTTTCVIPLIANLPLKLLGSVLVLMACSGADSGLHDKTKPTSVLKISTLLHRNLVENSVAVTSVTQPGIIFGVNDSGNEPLVFVFDSTGAQRGVLEVMGAVNRDWEAASLGPCGANRAASCLFIGDVGDNDARKTQVTIYQVDEPTLRESTPDSPIQIPVRDRLDFRYADHPHDVEAMYVTRDGSIFLITKRRLLDGQGRPRPALVFRLAPEAWDSIGIVTARLVDSLPIIPGETLGRTISDASLSRDGKLLAVRTYAEIFVFAMDSASGLPGHGRPSTICSIAHLKENQGEGVGWWWDGRRLLLTSEGRSEPFYVVGCRPPIPVADRGARPNE